MRLPSLVASLLVTSVLGLVACSSGEPAPDDEASADALSAAPVKNHLRYLAMNIGNVALSCRNYEYKLCSHDTSEQIRQYIAVWKPDVILLSEVLDEPQLDRVLHDSDIRKDGDKKSDLGGPILPPELGYAHVCHGSENRDTHVVNNTHPFEDENASHRHECVAWRTDRLALVGSAQVYGPNSPALRKKCNYDFTAQAATLRLLGSDDGTGQPIEVTGIAPHPASDSEDVVCRTDTLARMWKQLANKPRVFLGGDFNTGELSELQVPPTFKTNYSHGSHFKVHHQDEYSVAYYIRGSFEFDHAYSTFGKACTTCGRYYGGPYQNLPFGSALGSWHGHPWAANPGIDHRQILVDLDLD